MGYILGSHPSPSGNPATRQRLRAANELNLGARPENGRGELLDETYTFTVEDRTAPRVLAAQATAPKTIQVGFDEPLTVTDPSGFAFSALDVHAVPGTCADSSLAAKR